MFGEPMKLRTLPSCALGSTYTFHFFFLHRGLQPACPTGVVAGRVLESLVPAGVDREAFDLLKSLLDMNTRHRLTAQQALEHVFLRNCPRVPTAADDSSIDLVDEDALDFR